MFTKPKSVDTDFSFSDMTNYLDLMNKNILYLTHTMDKCLVVLKELELNKRMQRQISEFYDEGEAHLEPGSRTSPQTDTDEQ